MKRNKISKIIFIIFLIILITGIGGLLFLPNLYDFFKEDSVTNFAKHSIYYRGAFYICYITCLLIVYELICLFHQVYNSSPFKKEVVKALTICSVLFMFLSIIVVIKAFLFLLYYLL